MKKSIVIFLILLSLIFSSSRVFAQEELGFVNSNYAGVNSLFINPSFNVDSKIFIDVHFLGADAFIHNTVAYFPKEGFSPLFGQFNNIATNEKGINKKGFAKFELTGPSIGVSWDQHSFGISTRFRNYADAKMTKSLFVLATKEFDYTNYIAKNFHEKAYVNTISWFEVGFSYGHMFKYSTDETIDVGITLKRLIGVNAAGVELSNLDFVYNKKRDLSVADVSGGYNVTEAGWGIGKGWGFDIGANYQKKLEGVGGYKPNTKKGGCKHIDYKYKIGLSILDLGFFAVKSNAISQRFQYQNQEFNFDSTKVESFTDFDKLVRTNLSNNQVTQTRGSSYKALLPFALSGQVDYNFENFFYLNATMVASIKIPYQTKRVDIISVTPRYERKRFEIAVPVSLIDYRYPQLGFSFRLFNNFIIGTDRLGTLIGKFRNVYGADLYVHFKMAIFRKCSGSKKRYKKGQGGGCAAYQ